MKIRYSFDIYYAQLCHLAEFVHVSSAADSLFKAFLDASLRTVREESKVLIEALEDVSMFCE